LSKFVYDSLSASTRQLVAAGGTPRAAPGPGRRPEPPARRELKARTEIETLKRERGALDLETSPKSAEKAARSTSKSPNSRKSPALYDAERFKGVQISEYLQDFIKENPQSHTGSGSTGCSSKPLIPKNQQEQGRRLSRPRDVHRHPQGLAEVLRRLSRDAQRRLQANQLKPARMCASWTTACRSPARWPSCINASSPRSCSITTPRTSSSSRKVSRWTGCIPPHSVRVIMKINRQP